MKPFALIVLHYNTFFAVMSRRSFFSKYTYVRCVCAHARSCLFLSLTMLTTKMTRNKVLGVGTAV